MSDSATPYAWDFKALASNVPESLRQRPQWVAWQYVERDGEPTKVPISATKGGMASATDLTTWSTFDQAVAAVRMCDDLAGVGFVFSADDPFCGVDLDDCRDPETGTIAPWAQAIIDDLASYSEVSPSGTGVKVFIEGHKRGNRCRTPHEGGQIEIYDQARFFVVTGQHVSTTPMVVESRQEQLDALYQRLFGGEVLSIATPGPDAPPADSYPNPHAPATDDAVVRILEHSKKGERFKLLWQGEWSKAGYHSQSEADLSLVGALAFVCGRDPRRIDRLFRQSKLDRTKWDRADYRERTIAKALEGKPSFYDPNAGDEDFGCWGGVVHCPDGGSVMNAVVTPNDPGDASDCAIEILPPVAVGRIRPSVCIDTDEYRVVNQSIDALAVDGDLYQRGGMLVRVLRDRHPSDPIRRPDGAATIQRLPLPNLRERMTKHIAFQRIGPKNKLSPAHPPSWLVSAVDARGHWERIRHLAAISDTPVLRPDGTIWQEPGYDPVTGVLYDPGPLAIEAIPEDVDLGHALAAWELLGEVVCDFPFESSEHKSAWFAALLTPLARFTYAGPSPLFLFDANVRGAGKGLLVQVIARIALGREMPVSSYSHDTEEMRKKITSIAIAGDRAILLDNLEGPLGNDALDRALTTTRWKDRILGRSEQVDLPLSAVWFATGNNVQVAADTIRRIIHVRLDCLRERPEERADFKHRDLLEWVSENRGALVRAALIIVAAYIRRGEPDERLTPFGSFEGWSKIVRNAIVWLAYPDPCLTKTKLAETSDTTTDTVAQLIEAWGQYDPENRGLVMGTVLKGLYPAKRDEAPNDEVSIAFRDALENLTGCPQGKTPGTKQVGNRLKSVRRRVIGGRMLDYDPERGSGGRVWRIWKVK